MDYLSVDEAVAALGAAPEPKDQAHQDGAEHATSDELNSHDAQDTQSPEVDLDDAPETTSEDEVEESENDDAPPAATSIEAPHYLGADDKAEFAKLSPDAQQLFVKFEAQARTATSKAVENSNLARKAAENEAKAFAQHREALQSVLLSAQDEFTQRYSGVTPEDWGRWFSEDPQAASAERVRFEQGLARLQRLEAANKQASETATQNYLKAESRNAEELAKSNPTAKRIFDPVNGEQHRIDIVKTLLADGYAEDDIKMMKAKDWLLAADAHSWRQAQRKAPPQPQKASGTPAPKAPQSGKRMTAPTSQQTQPQSQAKTAANRFAQTNSVGDAVALLGARRQAQTNGRKTP